jgi:hypothetical protein
MKFSQKINGTHCSSFQLYSWAKREELYTSKQNLLFWGAFIVSIFLVMGQSIDSLQKKKKLKLGGTSSN